MCAVALILAVGLGSCGGASTRPSQTEQESPQALERTRGSRLAEFNFGRSITTQLGCLACHRIGVNGNPGPGQDLTRVGARLSAARIERAIVDPTAPMPSFRRLPKAKLQALVAYLALLGK
jgi:menaquinol-cytochrome c reductase cytochrome b/c subunit